MLILQEQLEEKDSELKRLKEELEQKTQMEAENNDSASDKKVSDDATIPVEDGNWALGLTELLGNFKFLASLSVH